MLNIPPAFWQFVDDHLGDDPNTLRLKYHGRQDCDFDIDLAITQVECRKRFGKKLAETLATHPHWLFADTLAGEQSTSDRLAAYHASLVGSVEVTGQARPYRRSEDEIVADLTSGLGIDVLHISQNAKEVYAVEVDQLKAEALRYNFADSNVRVKHQDCREWIVEAPQCSCMFIDPARRSGDGSRVYAIAQCQPDVIAMMPMLAQKTDTLVVKLSPMLDITQTFRELPEAHTIISLGTETECKELLALIDFRHPVTSRIVRAVTLKPSSTGFFAEQSDCVDCQPVSVDSQPVSVDCQPVSIDSQPVSIDSQPCATSRDAPLVPTEGMWLYDPYPAVMKAGHYINLTERYGVQKPSANTHLYFSDTKIDDFPGLCLRVERVIPFSSKYIKRLKSQYPKINVITRNFDMPADRLRQKLGVADGGHYRLYAITCADGQKLMVIAH